MSFADRHNKGNKFNYRTPEGTEIEFLSAKEVFEMGEPFRVLAIYPNDSGYYGRTYNLVSENGKQINAPKYMNEAIEEILESSEDIADINNGVVGVEGYEYVKEVKAKKGITKKKCYGLNWVDMESDLPFNN